MTSTPSLHSPQTSQAAIASIPNDKVRALASSAHHRGERVDLYEAPRAGVWTVVLRETGEAFQVLVETGETRTGRWTASGLLPAEGEAGPFDLFGEDLAECAVLVDEHDRTLGPATPEQIRASLDAGPEGWIRLDEAGHPSNDGRLRAFVLFL